MGKKKARKMMDSDSDLGLEEEMNDKIVHVRPTPSLFGVPKFYEEEFFPLYLFLICFPSFYFSCIDG